MPKPSPAIDVEETKAAFRREFSGWSIITTSRDRWWATRNPECDPKTRWLVDHYVTALDADTADELRTQLDKLYR
ncbi:hypothetical protein [Actinomadura rudentiformis]|uniref:Uncharacterized protein n=1 Tax=Actinomadura rudentiformis TaxID=359158 RepID=A0A6H9Z5K2_9ACTN|nr:hypothetical protein [Actinomadura rudentiformis]KAB2350120.1 hypothetical protein F8566_09955 [Actinomadura rudentiformis]